MDKINELETLPPYEARGQAEKFIEVIKSMSAERQGGLLLMLEGLKIVANKEKSGT